LLGELRRGRHYQSREIFLSAQLFTSDFARAFATFLHEHAHVYGYDGGRSFTDALTEVLETVVRNHAAMPALQAQWDPIAARVRAERVAESAPNSGQTGVADRIALLSPEELRAVLSRIPAIVVRRALNPVDATDGNDADNNQ